MNEVTKFITNIDPSFPVPGKDNNTQGFRSNFANIQQALTTLNNNFNSIAETTVNIKSPYVTATQTLTTLKNLQINTQTSIFVSDINNFLSVLGKNPDGTDAAGSIAFNPSVITVNTAGGDGGSDNTGTFFITSSPTFGILPSATFSCPSSGTGPFSIIKVEGNKIYYSGNGGLDPAVDIVNPEFSRNTILFNNSLENSLTSGVSSTVSLTSTVDSTTPSTGALTVSGGVGIAKNLNVGGNINLNGSLLIDGVDPFDRAFTNRGAESGSSYQKLPSGLIMAWGTIRNMPARGSLQVNFPVMGGRRFPNSVMNVQVMPSIPVLKYSYVGRTLSGVTTVNGGGGTFVSTLSYTYTITNQTLLGMTNVTNITTSGFVLEYYQEVISVDEYSEENPGGPGLLRTISSTTNIATSATIDWLAIGY